MKKALQQMCSDNEWHGGSRKSAFAQSAWNRRGHSKWRSWTRALTTGVCTDIGRTRTVIAEKRRPPLEAALSLGRKRPRRAYASLSPHRNIVMLRRSNCKHVCLAIVRL
jgi:hypothetical protein